MSADPETEAAPQPPLESTAPPSSAPPSTPTADAGAVDERNPWLGLASFTEETREYFYGRDEEVAELARRVQRKRLTLLFGQSGLGKTSILRAGLVPRLRGHGYCPVYVRIDYAPDAPEPAEQIKQAIASTARRSGQWTQAGVAVEGESLWEFLHHRDDVLQDESGETQIPLLIFDQFEEIFTLAQSDEFGRARAARFIADLADLVENRPPKELEERLERDDSAAERFDFARSDYRVLIALREDYLAPLEGLKSAMPSITQNRLRLAPMNGAQALEAVMRPGRDLVSQEVAEAIVRFVAGGAEIANAEVEPALLSLICRELNDARLAQGRSEISLDLVAGSHASILSNFYERCLADQPAAVRRIIEDELLTDSGFRENVAEERLLRSFADAGASPETLAVLVNRRLLRIEERLDVRRVELTHDVLCNVVKTSRDVRKEREARDAS
ncbi:MAG TPA: AAA family ATPase, partial [Stellaceae bacterium]|nr:AAA family ATPase [Stellaceae bacterium]